ncbi:RluA family pseudouridine synthase [Rhizorhapis suberifaciens]|uniref:tRNA pseudouridine32 synthase/23S rRNA pseudouridine746 synthase n=1 Tax=Rhizorhapis suberifaciens TaxID=13656 RepID=A0A840HR00_9SPHN|nr:RNA pseudouridine synthase [Rhizorhapis suberifaciens]MBB4639984.1 tRNA pseudouridine32 synthase/23S rRNA pseudouridine746 synthase [Rhizorhapis suberifaciens]
MLSDRVIFCDGEALVLDKPAGLAVDPPKNGGLSLENHLASLTFGFQRWPTAVHRLDRDTSGCLLLARNPKAHKRFAAAFEARQVVKGYVAVVEGVPADASGLIDLPLMKVSSAEEGWRMVVDPRGKSAVTRWEKLAEKDGRSFIRFFPETGRTHQIRAHALYGLGAAIVGDPVYGTGRSKGPMLLHSHFLSLLREGKPPVEATAPLPDRFIAAGFGPELLDV